MKYIKKFNNLKIGDYVKVDVNLDKEDYNKFHNFINNNIPIVTGDKGNAIECKYINIPEELKKHFTLSNTDEQNIIQIHKSYIVDFAKTKKELESKLFAKKYNL